MKNLESNLKIYQMVFVFIFLLFTVNIGTSRAEWVGPSGNPPNNNVMAPLNQGTTPQFKEGSLHIGDSTTMGGYLFSVSNGASYFEDLEVGGKATITASSGSFKTEGNISLQKGNISLQGGNLSISSPGTLSMTRGTSQLILNGGTSEGFNISIITDESGNAIKVNNNNTAANSVAILTGISNGVAIYGSSSGTGIGVFGLASGDGGIGVVGSSTHNNALAGRFDGSVRFNPTTGSTYTEINGGTATFVENGKTTTISSPLINMNLGDIKLDEGNIVLKKGDIELDEGDIEVHGEISMFINNIVELADPFNPLDAVNLQTLENQIAASSIWKDGIEENEIYYNDNVGIGTNNPEYSLSIIGQLGIGCNGNVSDNPVNSIRIGDAGFIYDSSCDSCPGGQCQPKTFHIDAEEGIIIQSDNFVAIKGGGSGATPGNYGIHVNDTGDVGIGTNDPDLSLLVAENDAPAYIGMLNKDVSIDTGRYLGILMFRGQHTSPVGSARAAASIEARAASNWGSDWNDSPTELIFKTQSSGVGDGLANSAMIIDENGNVGIGTVDPSVALEVNEDLKVSGNVYLGTNQSDEVFVYGGATVSEGLTVISGGLQITGGDTILGSVDATGSVNVTGDITANGAIEGNSICNTTSGTCLSDVSNLWTSSGSHIYRDSNVSIGPNLMEGWGGNYNVLRMGLFGSLASKNTGSGITQIGVNVYQDGATARYITNGGASGIKLASSGIIDFWASGVGNAGEVVSTAQVLRIHEDKVVVTKDLVYDNVSDRVNSSELNYDYINLTNSFATIDPTNFFAELNCSNNQLILVTATACLGNNNSEHVSRAQIYAVVSSPSGSFTKITPQFNGAMIRDLSGSAKYQKASIGWTDIYKCNNNNMSIKFYMRAKENNSGGRIYGSSNSHCTSQITAAKF